MPDSTPLGVADIRASFHGSFPGSRVGFFYQLALAGAALAMLLLPLVYVGIIAGAGYLVYAWATYGLVIFTASKSLWSVLAYLTPLVTGVILVLFMVKPLFAPRQDTTSPSSFDLDNEPVLRAYLEEICARVGVRLPVRVDLDCQVNASASFRRGWLSLGRRDLVLTIGLPLVRGLTARQLAGVIAHEFGHFAQRTSMAFSYTIRQVSGWFGRVVFARDRWDQWLEHHAKTSDWRIAAPLHVARGGVWVSRKILYGLMYAGHATCCFLMRQMEFDADYYAIRLAGSDDFSLTSRELRVLSVASGQAYRDLDALWHDRRLVRDFPQLVVLRRQQLSAQIIEEIDQSVAQQPARWHDTHPTDAARTARSKQANCAGVLSLDRPATDLFRDFTAVEAAAVVDMYRLSVGPTVEQASHVTAAEVSGVLTADGAGQEAWVRLTGDLVSFYRPLLLTLADLAPGLTDAASRLAAARAWLAQNLAACKAASEEDGKYFGEYVQATVARHYLRAGVSVQPGDFGLTDSNLDSANPAIQSIKMCRPKNDRLLDEAHTQIRVWLKSAVAATAGEPGAELRRLAETFALLSPLYSRVTELLELNRALAEFSANSEQLKNNIGFQNAMRELRETIQQQFDAWIATAAAVPYPFTHAQGAINVTEYLRISATAGQTYDRLPAGLQAAATLYFRLLGRMAVLGEQTEAPAIAAPAAEAPQ